MAHIFACEIPVYRQLITYCACLMGFLGSPGHRNIPLFSRKRTLLFHRVLKTGMRARLNTTRFNIIYINACVHACRILFLYNLMNIMLVIEGYASQKKNSILYY